MRIIIAATAEWKNHHKGALPAPYQTYSAEFRSYLKTAGLCSGEGFWCPATGRRYHYALNRKNHNFDLVCPNPRVHGAKKIYYFAKGGTVFVDTGKKPNKSPK
jgi:hypothetical protein